MKSKQLNFFITPDDRESINIFLTKNESCVMVDKYISTNKNPSIELPPVNEEIFQIYLTKKEFIQDATILSTNNNVEYYDVINSPLLQFSLGGFYSYDRTKLQRARFYYIEGYYLSNEFIYKSDKFRTWASNIIATFKKQFLKKYPKDKSFLYSESAIQWIEENEALLIEGGQKWAAFQS